jgi:hypothetical protein
MSYFVGQQNEVTEVEANPAIATGWGFGPFISEVQVRQASVIALVAFGGGPAVQLFLIGGDGRLYSKVGWEYMDQRASVVAINEGLSCFLRNSSLLLELTKSVCFLL